MQGGGRGKEGRRESEESGGSDRRVEGERIRAGENFVSIRLCVCVCVGWGEGGIEVRGVTHSAGLS